MNTVNDLRHRLKTYSCPKVAIVLASSRGISLSKNIKKEVFPSAHIYGRERNASTHELIDNSVKSTLQHIFNQYDLIICVMAVGIVIRSTASCLECKLVDPAIIVADEKGDNMISLLSGHVGRANYWTVEIAKAVGSNPVITTATDVQGAIGLDDFAMKNQLLYENFKKQTLRFNDLIANDKAIALINESSKMIEGNRNIQLLDAKLTSGNFSDYQAILVASSKYNALVSYQKEVSRDIPFLQLVPQTHILGIGCRKETNYTKIAENLQQFLQQENIHPLSIFKIVSIDLKRNEEGIIQLAREWGAEFITYSKEELLPYEHHFPSSSFVKKITGVGSVAQTSAYKASKGNVVTKRYANHGITFCIAYSEFN